MATLTSGSGLENASAHLESQGDKEAGEGDDCGRGPENVDAFPATDSGLPIGRWIVDLPVAHLNVDRHGAEEREKDERDQRDQRDDTEPTEM
jgi:hypothetical protein